jgi:hypothetical protein
MFSQSSITLESMFYLFKVLYLNYLRNYLYRVINGAEREPLFPIQIWNMHNAVVTGTPRTNNGMEGFHQAFKSHFNNNVHPPLSK